MKLANYLKGVGVGIVVTTLVLSATNMLKPEMTDEQIKARATELGMVDAYESGVLLEKDAVSEDAVSKNKIAVEPPALLQDEDAKGGTVSDDKTIGTGISNNQADDLLAKADKTAEPTKEPTKEPTVAPTKEPTVEPTKEPTKEPTVAPTKEPTKEPTVEPTKEPTKEPTAEPTKEPTVAPTKEPTKAPSGSITIKVNGGEGSQTVAKKLADAGIVADAAEFDQYLCKNGYDSRIAVGTYEFTKGMSAQEIAEKLVRR